MRSVISVATGLNSTACLVVQATVKRNGDRLVKERRVCACDLSPASAKGRERGQNQSENGTDATSEPAHQ